MKPRLDFYIHIALALGGVFLAYREYTDTSPEVGEDEVLLVECDADEITRVELVAEDKEVTLEMREERGERVAWFTVERTPEQGEATTERFVGAEEALATWLETFAPFRARRSLGELTERQLRDVGLAEPEGRLAITCGGETATYVLGARAYGEGDRYARARSGGPAYLFSNEKLQPLESAEFRLMQRDLHTFETNEIVGLRIRAFDRERRVVQVNRTDEASVAWADAESPDRRDEMIGSWLAHFERLRVQSYLAPRAEPGSDIEGISAAGVPIVRIDYTGEEGNLGFVDMQRVDAAEPAYYARSEATRSWVRVAASVAQQIEDDLRPIFGQPPIERAPPPQPDAGVAADAGAVSSEPSAAPDAGPPSEPADAGRARRPRPPPRPEPAGAPPPEG